MNATKRRRMKKTGWVIGSTADFLGLSAEESALVEMKLALARDLGKRRRFHGMTQVNLAERLGTSQSRVAKMESADGSVTLDLLVRALLALGATQKALARTLGTQRAA